MQQKVMQRFAFMVQSTGAAARVCHRDLVLAFEIDMGDTGDGEAEECMHCFACLPAAAGRQAHISPQQQFSRLDVVQHER